MGTIVANVQSNKLSAFATQVHASGAQKGEFSRRLAEAHGNPAALKGFSGQVVDAAKHALASGISSAYYVGASVLIVGALVAWALLRRERAADAEAPAVKPPVTPRAHPALGAAAK